jgi:hypothetical protein
MVGIEVLLTIKATKTMTNLSETLYPHLNPQDLLTARE